MRESANDSILCVISARGGSQGVPEKNIRPLLGTPLIVRAIQTALEATEIQSVFVSTDSKEIATVSSRGGALIPFMRPPELAKPNSGKFQVWQHALTTCETLHDTKYSLYVDVDCTNPLIESSDITDSISQFRSLQNDNMAADAVFSVSHARRNPYFNMLEPDERGVLRMSKTKGDTVLARQDAPTVFDHIAGVYVLDTQFLRTSHHLLEGNCFGYVLPEGKAMDIDSEIDFKIAEHLLNERIVASG